MKNVSKRFQDGPRRKSKLEYFRKETGKLLHRQKLHRRLRTDLSKLRKTKDVCTLLREKEDQGPAAEAHHASEKENNLIAY